MRQAEGSVQHQAKGRKSANYPNQRYFFLKPRMLTEYEIKLLRQNKFKMGEAAWKIYQESKFSKKVIFFRSNVKHVNIKEPNYLITAILLFPTI